MIYLRKKIVMVGVAQLVAASDCGSEGRGFESRRPPHFMLFLHSSVILTYLSCRGVAQLVAHSLWERGVASSSLAAPTTFLLVYSSFINFFLLFFVCP